MKKASSYRKKNEKRNIVPVIAVVIAVVFFLLFYSDIKNGGAIPFDPAQYGGNLKEITVGIPSSHTSDFSEVRDVFSVDETRHAVQAWWEPSKNEYEADFIWFDPDGNEVYRTTMNMQPEWRRTFVHYRGSAPLAAGKWTVAVAAKGKYLGGLKFNIVRDRSEIPVVEQLSLYDNEKISLDEAHFLLEKIKCLVDGKCEKENLFYDVTEDLAARKISLAVFVFRNGKVEQSAVSSAGTLIESLGKVIDNLEVKSNGNSSVELTIIHSGMEIDPVERIVSSFMNENRGFSFSVGDRQATLLPMDIARRNINEPISILRQLSVDAGMGEEGWRLKNGTLTTFMTQDFVLTSKGEKSRKYSFSRAIVPVEKVSRDDLVNAVDLAVKWCMKNQLEDGRYMYTYFPDKDEEPDDDWALRNLNAVFVLAEIAKDRNDPEMIKSVRKAIDVFRSSLVEKEGIKYVDWKKHIPVSSIAGTAFLLASMTELYDPSYKNDMRMMADAVISLQEESGRFRTDFYRPLREIDQMYYPGESLLALMRYYNLTKYEPALDAVKKAFPYYRNFWRQRKNRDGPFVPWQVRAYHEAWKVTKKQEYANFVFDLTDWLIKRYPPLGREAGHGIAGVFKTQFMSTAVYSEGMAHAFDLALELEDRERIETYGRVLKGNLGYLLGLQFKKEDSYWMKRGDKAVGGIALRPDNNEVTLAATYHAVSAFHYVSQLLNDEQWNNIKW